MRRQGQRKTLRGCRGGLVWFVTLLGLVVLVVGALGYHFVTGQALDYTTLLPGLAAPAPDYIAVVLDYRRAERAALRTLNDEVMAQLPVYASGEALQVIVDNVTLLEAANTFRDVDIESLTLVQTIEDSSTMARLMTEETHRVQTFFQIPGTATLLSDERFDVQFVYQLENDGIRWRVTRAVLVSSTVLSP